MTIQEQMQRREFKNKVEQLDLEQLRVLFDELKKDEKTPLGMLGYISNVYARKASPVKL